MDSIKSFKGYGKVDEAEDRAFKRKARCRIAAVALSAIVLVAIVVGVIVTVVVNNKSGDGGGGNQDASPTPVSNSIKAVCSVTQYPDTCFHSISSIKGANATTDPEALLKLSLHVASNALSDLALLPEVVTVPSDDKRLELAVRDCKELLGEAADRLKDAISAMSPASPGGKILTASKIHDIRTWLSAALANQDTCLEGFDGTYGSLRDRFEATMTHSVRSTSNSLAIATGILGILRSLDLQLHRKLLSAGGTRQAPGWITPSQRRALLQATAEVAPNLTVAQDGSGDVKTITEAIEMIPKKSLDPFVVYVKRGTYEENIVLDKNRWNVHVYGDGMHDTIVSGSLNFLDGTPTYSTATFGEPFITQI